MSPSRTYQRVVHFNILVEGEYPHMDGAFELPIHIAYRPPPWLAGALILSHSATIICILGLAVLIWLKLVMATATIVSCLAYWRKYIQCHAAQPVQLILNSADEWKLVDGTGAREVQLLPQSLVHPVLLVLRFRDDRRVH
ncbi:MAG: hypothetical protein HW386_753, partial [Gammaproteobacteria bacterium]|nr:hypothetical protein [Gammaproteobacteria bacterium]